VVIKRHSLAGSVVHGAYPAEGRERVDLMDALKTSIASEASAPKGKQPRKAHPMTARMTIVE